MTPRVKVCGITNLEDALHAVECGADALGFVFYSKSPRYITPDAAVNIVNQLPPFVTPVALFVDADVEDIMALLSTSSRWCLQFHGSETPDDCERFGVHYYKAFRMKPGIDLVAESGSYLGASAILLDAYKPGVPGGTGETFDWYSIPKGIKQPIILAGGLDADNVALAVSRVAPYAVDVSGGVEAIKGKKDPMKVKRFIQNAKESDSGIL